jgi:hypothetical protein
MGPSVSREIASPPETAWRLLTHVDEWSRWGPTVAGGEVPGGVISAGARGTVRTAVGVSLPFILFTFIAGWTNRFSAHRRLARWVFPLWLYVAINGPICYWMLRPYYG